MENEKTITYDETGGILTGRQWNILAASLKSIYGKQNFLADEFSMILWFKMVKDIPYDVLTMAVQKYIQTEHFPPTPSDIRKFASEVAMSEISDWSKGWEEVQSAMSTYGNCMYDKDRFDTCMNNFTPVTRECVKRLGWLNLCMSENQEADRANFRIIYEQMAKRMQSDALLSPNLRTQIEMKKAQLLGIEVSEC